MFKKLKYRLLFLNIVLITALIAIAFTSVYVLTLNRMNDQIQMELDKAKNFIPITPKPIRIENQFTKPEYKSDLPDRIVTFVLHIDGNNNLISADSFFEEDDEFYNKAFLLTQENGNLKGRIKLDGADWEFEEVERRGFHSIFFIDITQQLTILNRLAYTFIFAYIIMLLLTFILSNYLTSESIKPIKLAFNKQNQFISDASHELKTPLAVINTNVDVLLNEFADSEHKKWLQYIQIEVSRMSHLTENLLYLSSIDIKNSFDTVNISELAEHIVLGLEAVAYEKNIKLTYNITPNLYVSGLSEQLSQIMMILLDNAMKYTAVDGYVDFSLISNASNIYITIENNGLGISKENISKVFDRFYKQDSSRHFNNKSYGLGLAIAQSIVHKHKGQITCESTPNHQTSFVVKLHKL